MFYLIFSDLFFFKVISLNLEVTIKGPVLLTLCYIRDNTKYYTCTKKGTEIKSRIKWEIAID